jgi:hypothetical protein
MSTDDTPGRFRGEHPNQSSNPDRNNPKLMADRAANERILRRGVPALAFVDHPLPDDAIAIVYLGQKHALSRFIVVQQATFTDNVLDTAMELALQWQRDYPSDISPMKAVLFKDGQYRVDSGGSSKSGTISLRRTGNNQELMSPELLQRASGVAPTPVPGIGQARVVTLK